MKYLYPFFILALFACSKKNAIMESSNVRALQEISIQQFNQALLTLKDAPNTSIENAFAALSAIIYYNGKQNIKLEALLDCSSNEYNVIRFRQGCLIATSLLDYSSLSGASLKNTRDKIYSFATLGDTNWKDAAAWAMARNKLLLPNVHFSESLDFIFSNSFSINLKIQLLRNLIDVSPEIPSNVYHLVRDFVKNSFSVYELQPQSISNLYFIAGKTNLKNDSIRISCPALGTPAQSLKCWRTLSILIASGQIKSQLYSYTSNEFGNWLDLNENPFWNFFESTETTASQYLK